MRSLLVTLAIAALAIAALGLAVIACGGDRATSSAPRDSFTAALLAGSLPDTYKSTTADGIVYDGDDGRIRFYGREASASDRREIEAVVRRYYAAAAKRDGAAGCALMSSLTVEAIPEDFEELRGVHAHTCTGILFKLFEERHRELVSDSATLEAIDVRVEGAIALALLRFARQSELKHFAVHREGPTWKIWEVFAAQMP